MTDSKSELEHAAREQRRRQNRLWKDWPKGHTKCETVLQFILTRQGYCGVSEAEIRQFIWEKNNGVATAHLVWDSKKQRHVTPKPTEKNKAPAYYWMTILRYPENGKLSLLDGWCEKVSAKPNRWRLKPGVEIKPPWLLPDHRREVQAKTYLAILGHRPEQDGIHLHQLYKCPNGPAYDGRPPNAPWMCYEHDLNECCCPIPADHWIKEGSVPPWFRKQLGLS